MSNGQKWYVSHAETIVQNVLGLLIAFIILRVHGLSTHDSVQLQIIFFFASYARSYAVRRFFNKQKKEINPVTSTKRHKQRQRQQRSRWAMNEFETLEQYQNSIKEFNERTRLEFEDFIQKQGSDRNKLQLRCTPFTEKKGGYGSFGLS